MGEELEKKDPQEGHKPWGIVWIPFLAFLIYVLSIGPAVRFIPRNSRCIPALQVFYYPIFFAELHSEPIHRIMNWYFLNIWRASLVDV